MKPHVIAILAIAVLVLLSAGCAKITGDGEKVGTVIKLSHEGFFCKTWEGEMVRGGLNGGSGGFSTTPLYFTINDPGLLAKVQAALDQQYEVRVHYVEYYGPFPCSSENQDNIFLVGIERRN